MERRQALQDMEMRDANLTNREMERRDQEKRDEKNRKELEKEKQFILYSQSRQSMIQLQKIIDTRR